LFEAEIKAAYSSLLRPK